MIKLIQTILIFIILLSFYIDIANAQIVVKDFRGKIIHLDKPVERVVCLIESALTGIYMLKQGHKVVGIPTNVYTEGFYYSDTFKYYALLDERIREKKIPAVGNWEFVNVEKVLSLKPDLIIIWANQRDTIEILERLGIPVYGVFITKIDDILKEIRDFGILFNAKKRAEELIRYIKEEIRKIEEIAKKIKSKKRIYFSWAQHSFLQTSCGGSIVDEIINTIGAINVCGNIKAESQNLTMEKLILLNPDIIIMWYSKTLKLENIKKNKQYKIINAIKNEAVYQFDDTFFFDLWTLKFLYSMKFIAKVSYPEYYKFELAKEKQRIMRLLYDKDLI
ncbi:MAG: ABC transporter substrate-binding protein [Thermodesulfovibrionaceae bacterium]